MLHLPDLCLHSCWCRRLAGLEMLLCPPACWRLQWARDEATLEDAENVEEAMTAIIKTLRDTGCGHDPRKAMH